MLVTQLVSNGSMIEHYVRESLVVTNGKLRVKEESQSPLPTLIYQGLLKTYGGVSFDQTAFIKGNPILPYLRRFKFYTPKTVKVYL